MESIQQKFVKADAICRESKLLIDLEEDWYSGDKDTKAMNKIFIQRKKVKTMIEEYNKKPSLITKE